MALLVLDASSDVQISETKRMVYEYSIIVSGKQLSLSALGGFPKYICTSFTSLRIVVKCVKEVFCGLIWIS